MARNPAHALPAKRDRAFGANAVTLPCASGTRRACPLRSTISSVLTLQLDRMTDLVTSSGGLRGSATAEPWSLRRPVLDSPVGGYRLIESETRPVACSRWSP